MQTIYIDISSKGVVPTIYAKQGDIGRKFEVIFTNSGLPYTIPADSVFSVWYSGESGEGNYTNIGDNSAFYVNENKVTVELITQMLTNDGNGILCIVLNESNGNQIGSWNIPYLCEKVPGIESEAVKEYYTAFSKSVEGLKQITENLTPEAIGAHPDTWLPTIAEIGAAPSGYGLGGKAETAPNNDANQITKCGVFRAYVNTPTGDWWTIQQEDLYGNGTHMIQKASCFAYTFVLHAERMVVDGKFYEWEWVNPPMVVGKEYRTTERWNDKPVYRKLVSYYANASLGTTTFYIPHGIENFGQLVRITGTADSRPFPVLYDLSKLTSVYAVNGSDIYIRCVRSDLEAGYWYFDIAYTKA